ncbi:MAG: glycosyltransferase family 4 protein [Sulfuriferula sp.]
MKILFFTPIVLTSAIGRVSKLIVYELQQRGHEVVIVRAEEPSCFDSPTHPFSCQIEHWNNTEQVRLQAEQSDLIVYQIGNYYAYHRGCLEWLPQLPGLVSLHDNFLGHLFWAWSETVGRPHALEVLAALYGTEVSERFFNHSDSSSFIEYASTAAPMTEWIAAMSSAVIVHSSWAMDRIAHACPGPVEVVALPYDAPFAEHTDMKNQSVSHERTVALTIGHVNHNKRYTSVIKAIGSSPELCSDLTYRIVGAIEPAMAEELQSLADQLQVDITITGAVNDECLAEEIHRADLMCCLRWPALEAASASTIEAMLYSKPTVVTNTGFYLDLPDDCVLKVSPETELTDLRTALERLTALPDERHTIGNLARNYALKTFRADDYATRIMNMKHRIDRSNVVGTAASVFSSTLKRWGARGDPAVMEAITAPLGLIS